MSKNKYLIILSFLVIVFVIILRGLEYRSKIAQQTEPPVQIIKEKKGDIAQAIEPIVVVPVSKPIPAKSTIPRPYISAESYLVGNLDTGRIYDSFNKNKVFPIASVSKLYTSLVVHHLHNPDDPVVITQSMLDAYGESGNLSLGEKFKSSELLYALLLESSNDAAQAFAETFGYEDFIKEMNAFAQEVGMRNTFFKDPSGLNPANVSSSEDLFVLSRYLYKDESEILTISKTKEMDLATTTEHNSHHFVNINPYSNYSNFIGGKTGRTEEAKESMVSLFKEKYLIAIIILRSDFGQREIDTEKLLGMFIEKTASPQLSQ